MWQTSAVERYEHMVIDNKSWKLSELDLSVTGRVSR